MEIPITLERALELMDTNERISFYEYYDGVFVNDDFIIENTDYKHVQNAVFEKFPDTNITHFSYTSRFASEIDFKCMEYVPKSLVELTLANFNGVDVTKIDCVTCYHQDEEYLRDDGELILDDTKKYFLSENNKWTRI